MARTASLSEVEEEEDEEEDRRLRPPVVVVVAAVEEHLRTNLTEEVAVVVAVARRKRCFNGCDVVRLHTLSASIALPFFVFFSFFTKLKKGFMCVFVGLSTSATYEFGPQNGLGLFFLFFFFFFFFFFEGKKIHFFKTK